MAAKQPLIVIVGPTASGKTALGVELAKRFDGEIICADSRTVYVGMDISTAKPSALEMQGVPHHLLDVVVPSDRFTVADFKRRASQVIDNITAAGRIPIMVGGSGMYIDSILYDYQFATAGAPRNTQNPRHLLEPKQSIQKIRPDTLILGLSIVRELLRRRIEQRVDAMVENGLIEELTQLLNTYGWGCAAFDAPAFKAFKPHLQGSIGFQEAKQLFVTYDMQLAKKQMTWFNRNKSIHWLHNKGEYVDLVTTFLNKYQ